MRSRTLKRAQRVAVLLAGDLRAIIDSGNWKSWVDHVVSPLQSSGYSVDTFLCTSPVGNGSKPLPEHASRELRVARTLFLPRSYLRPLTAPGIEMYVPPLYPR